jgi:hypothetical protein
MTTTIAPLDFAIVDADQAAPGAPLNDSQPWSAVDAELAPADFQHTALRHLHEACGDHARSDQPFDPVVVKARLDADGHLGTAVPVDLANGPAIMEFTCEACAACGERCGVARVRRLRDASGGTI